MSNDNIPMMENRIRQIDIIHHQVRSILLTAIELRDPYTKGHSDRVGEITKNLAAAMYSDLFPYERSVKHAAQLHDIGKIGINDLVLNKSTYLTEAERIMIEAHTKIGAKILEPLNLPPDDLLYNAVLYHHENYDGSGYPMELKGEEIPLIARIVHVADYFEALTQRRAYREAYSCKEALALMEKNHNMFDPDILTFFMTDYRNLVF